MYDIQNYILHIKLFLQNILNKNNINLLLLCATNIITYLLTVIILFIFYNSFYTNYIFYDLT